MPSRRRNTGGSASDHGREVTLLALRNEHVRAVRDAERRRRNVRTTAGLGVAAGYLQHRAFELTERNHAVTHGRTWPNPVHTAMTPDFVRSSRPAVYVRRAFTQAGADIPHQMARAAYHGLRQHEILGVGDPLYERIHHETEPPIHLEPVWHHPRVTGWEIRPE